MTENFPEAVKNAKGSNKLDTNEHIDKYAENSNNSPVFKGLKNMYHFNKHTLVLINTLMMY